MDPLVDEIQRVNNTVLVFKGKAKEYRDETAYTTLIIPRVDVPARSLKRVFTDVHLQVPITLTSPELDKMFDGFDEIVRRPRKGLTVEFDRTAIVALYAALLHEIATFASRSARRLDHELLRKPEAPQLYRFHGIPILNDLQELSLWLSRHAARREATMTIHAEERAQ